MDEQKAYKLAKNNVKCCYLCGEEKIKVLGCFVPHKPTNWLLDIPPPGKKRTYWYGLCEKCFNLYNREKLVEKKMESEMN